MTSRSFAAVILELHPELRDAMMLFYIILRGLDTIEDDTTLDLDTKIPILRNFRDEILSTKDWTFDKNSPKEKDRVVLVEFDKVLREYHKIKPEYREVVADITHKMGNGMADYAVLGTQKNYEGVKTIQDYKTYCHYVAGLVGDGVTRLALLSKFGTTVLEEKPELKESMGQFLQRTNIIRDFREDLDDGRSFWPREVWGKYAKALADFTDPANVQQAQYCVSDLVVLSLELVPELLEYLQNVKEQTLFSFCAIPQVMSIATLELIFNNPKMFHQNVKIRRGLSCRLIEQCQTMEGVYDIFREFTHKIHQRNRVDDPNYLRVEIVCGKIDQFIDQHSTRTPKAPSADELARKEQRKTEFLLLLAGLGGLFLCFGAMTFFAWLFGARFDLFHAELKDGLYELMGWERPYNPALEAVGGRQLFAKKEL